MRPARCDALRVLRSGGVVELIVIPLPAQDTLLELLLCSPRRLPRLHMIFGVFGPPHSISSHQLSSPRRRRSTCRPHSTRGARLSAGGSSTSASRDCTTPRTTRCDATIWTGFTCCFVSDISLLGDHTLGMRRPPPLAPESRERVIPRVEMCPPVGWRCAGAARRGPREGGRNSEGESSNSWRTRSRPSRPKLAFRLRLRFACATLGS